MAFSLVQHSYNAGEIGELLYGRGDDQKYSAALARCLNATVLPQGPVQNRAGFMYVNTTKETEQPVRLIPFAFSSDQTMVLEFGHHYIRFHTQGQTLMTEDGSAVYEVETEWDGEDIFDLHYAQNADIMTIVHPDYAPMELRRYDIYDWRLVECDLLPTLTPPENVVAERITEAESDDNADKYTQKYVVTCLNSDRTEESERSEVAEVVANLYATGTTVEISWDTVEGAKFYRVYKLSGGVYGYIGETTENSIIDDNIGAETGTTPPYVDDVFQVSGGITAVTITDGGSGYAGTNEIASVLSTGTYYLYDSEGNLTESGTAALPYPGAGQSLGTLDYEGFVDLEGSGSGATATYTTSADYDGLQNSVASVTVANGGSGYTNPVCRFQWKDASGNVVARLDLNTTLESNIELTVEDESGYGASIGFEIQNGAFTSAWVESAGRNYENPTVVVNAASGSGASFSLEVGNAGDYPAAVGYFEQRRIFAGSRLRPQQMWMTVSGTESNMTYHLPLVDTDRISFAVASQDLNMIRHVVPLSQLLVLTSAAEWRVSPLNSDAITPDSISVRPQAYVGASNVQPLIANSNIIYVAARGGHVREFAYNYNAGGYITGDLSIRVPHFFEEENPPVQLALQKAPEQYIWAVMTNGELFGLSYVPEQSVGGWFEYQTDGSFESVCVVQEDSTDRMYVVVKRTIGGETRRFIERMNKRNDDSVSSGLYLDCAAQFVFSTATKTISGATWLAGGTVTVVADGFVYKNVEVSDEGVITMPVEVSTGWIGFPYETVVKTLPLSLSGLSDGSYGRGHVKNVNKVKMRLYNTTGIEVGPDEDHLRPMKVRSTERYGAPVDLQSGEITVPLTGDWQKDGSVTIVQEEPVPFTLLSHVSEVEFGG